jgi:hypothetical protein
MMNEEHDIVQRDEYERERCKECNTVHPGLVHCIVCKTLKQKTAQCIGCVRKQIERELTGPMTTAPLAACSRCGATIREGGPCINCSLNTTQSKSGAKSSPAPRFDLLPRRALERVSARYEKGLERYGRDNWRKGLTDKDYIVERIAHVIGHCYKLIEKLESPVVLEKLNADDDAGAIAWGGLFVCEAMCEMEAQNAKANSATIARSSNS